MFAQQGSREPRTVEGAADPNAPGTEAHPETEYQPLFQLNVTENIGAFTAPVSMYKCLAEQSVEKLQALLRGGNAGVGNPSNGFSSQVVHYDPRGRGMHGQVSGTQNIDGVPYLAFSDGTIVNAGDLARFWTHGYGDKAALQNALLDVVAEQADRARVLAAGGYGD